VADTVGRPALQPGQPLRGTQPNPTGGDRLINKIPLLLVATLLLTTCEKPMPFESAETLADNPEKLEELRLQCRD
jgi:hypothetical protein